MEERNEEVLFRSVFQPGRRVYLLIGILLAIIAWAIYAYLYQLNIGLAVTGLNRPVFWGIYMWLASSVVLTLDSSAWYAGRSWFTLLLFVALAGYGFWVSLSGRPLLKSEVLEGG